MLLQAPWMPITWRPIFIHLRKSQTKTNNVKLWRYPLGQPASTILRSFITMQGSLPGSVRRTEPGKVLLARTSRFLRKRVKWGKSGFTFSLFPYCSMLGAVAWLLVRRVNFKWSSLGSNSPRDICIEFLGRPLYSQSGGVSIGCKNLLEQPEIQRGRGEILNRQAS